MNAFAIASPIFASGTFASRAGSRSAFSAPQCSSRSCSMLEKMALCARPSSTSRSGVRNSSCTCRRSAPYRSSVSRISSSTARSFRSSASAFAFAAAAAFSACSSKRFFSSAITPS